MSQKHYYEISDAARTFRQLVRAENIEQAFSGMREKLRAEKPRSWSKYSLHGKMLNLAPAQVEGCDVLEVGYE